MNPAETALVLIGYQNDYFAPDGVLASVIEESARAAEVLANTVALVAALATTRATIVATPIIFTPDYSELLNPVGILKTVRDLGAFRAGSHGSETVGDLLRFGDRISCVPGKRGLNAFSNTDLDALLSRNAVRNVVLAGVVTSICIDSTARSASERGYDVTVLRDCTASRTKLEHDFYCDGILPLYSKVTTSRALLASLDRGAPKAARITA